MGGLIQFMPFTYTVMLIGTIALLGLPWLSGFYSKDLILELAYGNYQFSSTFAFILGTLTAFLTAFYSIRLINLVYLTMPNAKKTSYLNIHSEDFIVIIPLSVLALFAIFLGFVASDVVGVGSDFLGNSLFYHPSHLLIIEAEFSLPIYIKLMPTVLSFLGAVLAFYLYHNGHKFLTGLTHSSAQLNGPFVSLWSCAIPSSFLLPVSAAVTAASQPTRAGGHNSISLPSLSGSSVEASDGGQSQGEAERVSPLENTYDLKTNVMVENARSNATQVALGSSSCASVEDKSQRQQSKIFLRAVSPAPQPQRGRSAGLGNYVHQGLATFIVISYTFLNGKYLLDNLFNNYLISGGLKLGYIISKLLDKGLIELVGPFGLTEGSYFASYNLTQLDTGVITTYALYITLGLISILFILFTPLF